MAHAEYHVDGSMREARALYFALNGFGADGGYGADWVSFKVGPVPVRLPNTAERVRAVRYHDLHHVITGYETDLAGEFEIAAWELGAGCKDFHAAWFLNLGGLAAGVVRCPARTFRAFVRGRRSRSLYGLDLDELLGLSVREARARSLSGAGESSAQLGDVPRFLLYAAAGFVSGLVLIVAGSVIAPLFVLPTLVRAKGLQRASSRVSASAAI